MRRDGTTKFWGRTRKHRKRVGNRKQSRRSFLGRNNDRSSA